MAIRVRVITDRKPYLAVRKLRPEQVQELVDAYRAGATMKGLAAKFQIHRTTVSAHLHRQGVPPQWNR